MATVFERVRKVLVYTMALDEDDAARVVPSMSFMGDLQLDSLDVVDFMLNLEDEFSAPGRPFLIPDEDAESADTIEKAVAYLKRQGFDDTSGDDLGVT